MWKTIRKCFPSKDSTRLPCRRDPNLLAEEFNAFFTSVGSNTADKVKQLANDYLMVFNLHHQPFLLPLTNLVETLNLISLQWKKIK